MGPKELSQVLAQSDVAQRLCARGWDIKPEWAKGALVLVKGLEAQSITEDRGRWDVVLHQADEQAIVEAIRALPYNKRPRLKETDGRFLIPDECSWFDDLSGSHLDVWSGKDDAAYWRDRPPTEAETCGGQDDADCSIPIQVKRTFIHVAIAPELSPRTSKTWPWTVEARFK